MFILSSANAFNLDQSKNLSFGKELTPLGKRLFQNDAEKEENANNQHFFFFFFFLSAMFCTLSKKI